jgi:hypothetical protein
MTDTTEAAAVLPRRGICSWSRVPIGSDWREGVHYFTCTNSACCAAPGDRLISAGAWQRLQAEAGGRQWCRACLQAEWDRHCSVGPAGSAMPCFERICRRATAALQAGRSPFRGKHGVEWSLLPASAAGERPFFAAAGPDSDAAECTVVGDVYRRTLGRRKHVGRIILAAAPGSDCSPRTLVPFLGELHRQRGLALAGIRTITAILLPTPVEAEVCVPFDDVALLAPADRGWSFRTRPESEGLWQLLHPESDSEIADRIAFFVLTSPVSPLPVKEAAAGTRLPPTAAATLARKITGIRLRLNEGQPTLFR